MTSLPQHTPSNGTPCTELAATGRPVLKLGAASASDPVQHGPRTGGIHAACLGNFLIHALKQWLFGDVRGVCHMPLTHGIWEGGSFSSGLMGQRSGHVTYTSHVKPTRYANIPKHCLRGLNVSVLRMVTFCATKDRTLSCMHLTPLTSLNALNEVESTSP